MNPIQIEQMDAEMYPRIRTLLDDLEIPRHGSLFQQIEYALEMARDLAGLRRCLLDDLRPKCR